MAGFRTLARRQISYSFYEWRRIAGVELQNANYKEEYAKLKMEMLHLKMEKQDDAAKEDLVLSLRAEKRLNRYTQIHFYFAMLSICFTLS